MVFHLFSWHVHVTYSFKNLDFLNNPNCDDDESGRFSAWLLKTLFVFYQIRASIIIAFMFTICPSPLLIVEVTHQYTESRGCSCHWLRYKGIHHRRSAGSTPMWRESDHFFSFHTTVENKKFFFFFFFCCWCWWTKLFVSHCLPDLSRFDSPTGEKKGSRSVVFIDVATEARIKALISLWMCNYLFIDGVGELIFFIWQSSSWGGAFLHPKLIFSFLSYSPLID